MSDVRNEFDLQPDPRILPMLGEINLVQWKCLAELIDNAVDGFLSAKRRGIDVENPEISVAVPTNSDSQAARVTVRDNGPGMSRETLEKAVRAGWSGNDPVSNLGLFGMGFNIATARLGTVSDGWDASKWTGLHFTVRGRLEMAPPRKWTAAGLQSKKDRVGGTSMSCVGKDISVPLS